MKLYLKVFFALTATVIAATGLFKATSVMAEDYILGRPMTSEEIQEQEDMEPEYLPEMPEVPTFLLHKGISAGKIGELGEYLGVSDQVVFPDRYDLRELGYVSMAKNQGQYGTCWAFATMASLESNLIKNGIAESDVDLSEAHLTYYAFHQGQDALGNTAEDIVTYRNAETNSSAGLDYLDYGGNYVYSAIGLMNGKGAALEETWKYSPYSDSNMQSVNKKLSTDTDNAWNSNAYSVKEVKIGNAQDGDVIKRMLMDYGALYTNMYFKQKDSTVYNASTAAYYASGITSTNHAITIVGWDDNYSKNNFATKPQGDGAWICKNSWGATWGDEGYFYVSYYDSSINRSSVCAYIGEESKESENIYYYGGGIDLYDYVSTKGIAQVIELSGNENGKEKIESVGFYTWEPVPYTLQLYKNPKMVNGIATDPRTGEMLLETPIKGSTIYSGYVNIPLTEEIILEQGDTVAAVVTFDGLSFIGIDKDNEHTLYISDETTALGQTFIIGSTGKVTDCGGYKDNPFNVKMNITTEDVEDGAEAEEYTITYVLNGGKNDERNPEKYVSGDSFELYNPTKVGCSFCRWCTDAGMTYASRITDIASETKGNITLYAKFVVNKYSITFSGNGADSGSISDFVGCKYGSFYTLPKNTFVRSGYEFTGWNTKADGSGRNIKEGEKVQNLSEKDGDFVTLYAQWNRVAPAVYTITYNLNGGTLGNGSPETYTEGEVTVLVAPSRADSRFLGWYLDGTKVSCIGADIKGNIVLTAEWESSAKRFTITYVLNGGQNASGNPAQYIQGETVKLISAYKTGYTFGRWCTDSSLSYDSRVTEITPETSGDLTLYAKFTANKYNITFNGNGASGGSAATLSGCKYGTYYTIPQNVFYRNGYEFVGWNTKADGSGIAYDAGASYKNLSDRDGVTVTLYAQWAEAAQRYSVTYVLNGGVNSDKNPASYLEGESYTLAAPSNIGYTFIRWCTDASLSNISRITEISSTMSGDIILYAKFVVNKYNIAFDGNGASSGEVAAINGCKVNSTYVLPQNSFIKAGYEFICWNDKADGMGKDYQCGEGVRNLSLDDGTTFILYAKWKKAK